MRRSLPHLVALSLVLAACSGTGSASPTASQAPTAQPSSAAASASSSPAGVTVGTVKTSLGTFLVGPNGRTLYLFEADQTSRSTCSAGCAQSWPPFTASGPPIAGSGVKPSLLTTSQRGDGSAQVVYNGHPLYYYAGDTKPGDTLGEGLTAFGAGWDVVSPAGAKIEKPGS